MLSFPEFLQYSGFSQFIDWFVKDILLQHLASIFDFITLVIASAFNGVEAGLSFVPWFIYVIIVFLAGKKLYNYTMASVLSLMLVFIGVFGMWDQMIYTIAIVIISVVVSILVGLPMGILIAKNSRFERVVKPILDAMQTMPSFVYLIPAVMLFGLGRVPAVLATTIYALPPLIRLTYLGIKNVDKEVIEAGLSFGSTPLQMLYKIELPQALSTIMTGVNQTTMMAMAMVVISSMIGAKGIGNEVLIAINRLEVGRGFEAGFSIVFLAIILDRLLQGYANSLEGGVSHNE